MDQFLTEKQIIFQDLWRVPKKFIHCFKAVIEYNFIFVAFVAVVHPLRLNMMTVSTSLYLRLKFVRSQSASPGVDIWTQIFWALVHHITL